MRVLQGKTFQGLGVAGETLKRQLPLIARRFPEIGGAWPGTINVELRQSLVVTHPSHRSEPVSWRKDSDAPEVFDFLRIEFALPEDLWIPAWLYIAHNSPHRQSLKRHEILLPEHIPGVDPEDILIRISQPCTVIDYADNPLYIV